METDRANKVLLLLLLAPLPLVLHAVMPEAHTFLFVISILSILPLTVLLVLATEQLAARTPSKMPITEMRRHIIRSPS